MAGTITVAAEASDDIAVVGVQFLLDGANLGAEDTAAPYEIAWDTTAPGNGTHALAARARDAAGNETVSAAVRVTVDNPIGLPPGLIAHWTFDEGTGTVAGDASGNGRNGTLTNGPLWTTGVIGGALAFDGVNDYVQVADDLALRPGGGPYSVSAWFRTSLAQTATLWSKRQTTSPNAQLSLYVRTTPDAGCLYRSGTSSEEDTVAPFAYADGQWHHLAVSIANNSSTFYVDAVAYPKTRDVGTPAPTNADPIRIGDANGSRRFTGDIDDVRVYSRALSRAEVEVRFGLGAP